MLAILTGPDGSGKTTVFDGLRAVLGAKAGRDGRRRLLTLALGDDERLLALSEVEPRPKVTPARYVLADVDAGASEAERIGLWRQADVLVVVLGAFSGEDVTTARRRFEERLRALDAEVVGKRLGRLREALAKGGGPHHKRNLTEARLLERVADALERGEPVRSVEMSSEERRELAHFALLSAKPRVWLANTPEESPFDAPEDFFAVSAALEAELAEMAEDERAEFAAAYGIESLALRRLPRHVPAAGDWAIFYTIGKDEIRAWPVPRGLPVREAAGRIHTDFERNFIRAEVVTWEDVAAAGGWDRAVATGRMSSVGPEHPVSDGDVIYIRAGR